MSKNNRLKELNSDSRVEVELEFETYRKVVMYAKEEGISPQEFVERICNNILVESKGVE